MTHKQGDEVWVHRGMYVERAKIFADGARGYMYCKFADHNIISMFSGDIFTDRLIALNEMRDRLKLALKTAERQRASLRKLQAVQTEGKAGQ